MKPTVGLWIDHRKAVVVFASDRGVESMEIRSHVDKQQGRVAGRRSTAPFESQQVPADDSQDRRYAGQIRRYFDVVVAAIRLADPILIFGPGEAKGELRKHIGRARIEGRVVVMETADKMTDRQVAAKVRDYFGRSTIPAKSKGRRAAAKSAAKTVQRFRR